MGTSRFPGKVRKYCGQIALKIHEGKSWRQDWSLLISALYSKTSRSSLSIELGLPSSIPAYSYDPNDISELIEEMEDQLNSIAEDGQSADNDLQRSANYQQMSVAMVSGVSKMLHDSAMSIIRDIG